MFTRLCNATTDNGQSFTDQDVIDHMIFLMMAAHDTVTSTLTTSAYALAAHPDWQARLREEARAVGTGPLAYEDLDRLQQTEWAFNEAMRMYAPVPYIPRRALREFEWQGHRIPANSQVTVSPDSTHYDADIWTDPTRFDPERFSPKRAEHKRHAFAFAPYGGGAHKCLGMHFANILAKTLLHRLVLTYEFSVPDGYVYDVQQLPIPKPRDGLPMTLRRLV
jgi:cytochrome P450